MYRYRSLPTRRRVEQIRGAALRISDRTAFFLLGELIEYDDTERIFSTPSQKKTEDYITGRFG